ncbi:MAG: hypothetical protein ACYTDY_15390 [Planctomycetota bacterium]|jgi:hypothetical protein
MSENGAHDLATLVVRHRRELLSLVTHEAKGLFRYESADDLVQGIQLRTLERGGGSSTGATRRSSRGSGGRRAPTSPTAGGTGPR